MKKDSYLHVIAISLFLMATCIAFVIIGNQGERLIENALNDGYNFESINDQYNKILLGKVISAILLFGLFYVGWGIAKTFYLRQQIRFLLFPFVGIALVFGSLSMVIQKFLNPLFAFSYLSDFVFKFQVDSSIPMFIFYSVIGFMCLWASLPFAIIENAKLIKGISINSLGSKFNTLIFIIYFLIFFIIMIYLTKPAGLANLIILPYAVIYGFIGLATGNLSLLSFMKNGKLSSLNLLESIFQSFLSACGIIFFLNVLIITATGFDPAIISILEGTLHLLIPYIILYIVSSSISISVWHFNLLGVQSNVQFQKTKSELTFLKSQINPHFLFNSLNSIYGTAMAEQSPKTAEGVQKLSEMMRFMLKENTEDKISLEKEFNYINNYIDLQRLRVDENENTQIDVAITSACEGEITPMLLIPFIENAFKHGISLQDQSWIRIELTCTSETVSLEVENSIHKQALSKKDESGIGLENVKERLKLLYPEKHNLEIKTDEKTYFVHLNLNLQ